MPKQGIRRIKKAVEKKLVHYLIWYGTYLKTVEKKDFYMAEHCLMEALQIRPRLPVAHYRLGFLSYRRKSYGNALTHFERAIASNEETVDKRYRLTHLQQYYARLYLANSVLYVARDAGESLKKSGCRKMPDRRIMKRPRIGPSSWPMKNIYAEMLLLPSQRRGSVFV